MPAITAYFLNGPLNGKYIALEDAYPFYYVMENVGIDFDRDPNEIITARKIEYSRIPNLNTIREGEIVYYRLSRQSKSHI